MSIYEIISMQIAHGKRGKPVVSDKEFEEGQALLHRALGNDPSVRLD